MFEMLGSLGKTTTIRMLMGLATPTSGEVEILGMKMPERALEIRARIGHEEIVLGVRGPEAAERGCFAPARERDRIEVGVFHGGVEPARRTTP